MIPIARPAGPWAAFALSTVLLALGGCGRVPGQFEILNDQIPLTGCSIPTDTTVYRGLGTMDLSLVRDGARGGYVVLPLAKNTLPAPAAGDVDTNMIVTSSFAVDIMFVSTSPAAGAGRLTRT